MAKALEAAKAVNSLMNFSSKDSEALVEVIQDYFLLPEVHNEASDDSDEESENETDDWMEGIIYMNSTVQ